MNAGKLNERVIVQQFTESNRRGEHSSTWATLATVWAEVLPAGSREVYRQNQVTADINYVVRIRYRSDVTGKHRILWGSKILELVGAPFEEMVGGSQMLNCPCMEVEV